MAESKYLVVLITVGSQEAARKIADELVSRKKAACVNIVPRIRSIFRWEDRIEDDEENLLVVKTKAELFPGVVELVKGIHSYDVPEIIALPVIDGNEEYLTWIDDVTEGK